MTAASQTRTWRALALVALLISALALAACGGSDDPATSSSTETTSTEPDTTTADPAQQPDPAALAQQASGALEDATNPLRTAIVNFGEVAPVHASVMDLAATAIDAQAERQALTAFADALAAVELPRAAQAKGDALTRAARSADAKLAELEKLNDGAKATAVVEGVKRANEKLSRSAQALADALRRVAG